MKVKELISLLGKEDPEMDVLTADFEYWRYDIKGPFNKEYVFEGRKISEEEAQERGISLSIILS